METIMMHDETSTTQQRPATIDPAIPDDNTTLTEVLDFYGRHGFTSNFGVTAEGLVGCDQCDQVSEPERVTMHSLRRLEGASDPDDSLAVVALTCPVCAAQGVIALMYGPMASTEEAEVLRRLKDHRGDSEAPPDSAPGEADGHPDWPQD